MTARLQLLDIKKIARQYGLTVNAFELFSGGASNFSYFLQTNKGCYVLKVFTDESLPYVIKLAQLLRLLGEHNFPSTPLVLLLTGEVASSYRAKPVILKRYISGQVCSALDNAMLHQVGRAMARLHQIPPPDFLPDEHLYGIQLFSSVVGRDIDTEYESWLAGQLRYFKQHIPPNLPRGLIHGDLFYDNVLFEGGLKAIIDFETACCYYKAFDLGMAIVGLCTEATKFARPAARALVMGYQQVRVLEEAEKESLQLFIEYAATATSYWRFWKYHIDEPQAEKADLHWQMVSLAEEVRDLPKARFFLAIFSGNS